MQKLIVTKKRFTSLRALTTNKNGKTGKQKLITLKEIQNHNENCTNELIKQMNKIVFCKTMKAQLDEYQVLM